VYESYYVRPSFVRLPSVVRPSSDRTRWAPQETSFAVYVPLPAYLSTAVPAAALHSACWPPLACLVVWSVAAVSAFAFGFGSVLCVGFLSVPYAVSFALEAAIWLAQHPTATSAIWRLSVSLPDQAVARSFPLTHALFHANCFTVK
jgi:hypothetical protein